MIHTAVSEDEEGVSSSELMLSQEVEGRGRVEVQCVATFLFPDISITSHTLTVNIVGRSVWRYVGV